MVLSFYFYENRAAICLLIAYPPNCFDLPLKTLIKSANNPYLTTTVESDFYAQNIPKTDKNRRLIFFYLKTAYSNFKKEFAAMLCTLKEVNYPLFIVNYPFSDRLTSLYKDTFFE